MIQKTYDFTAKRAQYAEYDLASLIHARGDAADAERNFRGMASENYYRDDFLTLCDIIRERREAGEVIRDYRSEAEDIRQGELAMRPDWHGYCVRSLRGKLGLPINRIAAHRRQLSGGVWLDTKPT